MRRLSVILAALSVALIPAFAQVAQIVNVPDGAKALWDPRNKTVFDAQNPLPTTIPGTVQTRTPITNTQIIVTGTSGTVIAANSNRKTLRWMNVGAADVTIAPGTTPPAAGQGMVYGAGSAAGKQGGGADFSTNGVPTGAYSFSAPSSAIIVVWEGQ